MLAWPSIRMSREGLGNSRHCLARNRNNLFAVVADSGKDVDGRASAVDVDDEDAVAVSAPVRVVPTSRRASAVPPPRPASVAWRKMPLMRAWVYCR